MLKRGKTKNFAIDDIELGKRRRTPTDDSIAKMRESLRENRLIDAIGVRMVSKINQEQKKVKVPVVVYGATRLAAAKLEGWTEIEASVLAGTDIDFAKAEIAENLHRGELTKLDHDEHLVAYRQLLQEEAAGSPDAIRTREGDLFAENFRETAGRPTDPSSRRTAAKELGVDEKAIRQAEIVAGLPQEVKDAARALGFADNRTLLLRIAKEASPEAQLAKMREMAEPRVRPAKPKLSAMERQLAALKAIWAKAGAEARTAFWPTFKRRTTE